MVFCLQVITILLVTPPPALLVQTEKFLTGIDKFLLLHGTGGTGPASHLGSNERLPWESRWWLWERLRVWEKEEIEIETEHVSVCVWDFLESTCIVWHRVSDWLPFHLKFCLRYGSAMEKTGTTVKVLTRKRKLIVKSRCLFVVRVRVCVCVRESVWERER